MRRNWRQILLLTSVFGIEGCVLYTVTAIFTTRVSEPGLSVFAVLLLYPAAIIFNILLQHLKWPGFWLRIINWLAWALAVLLVLKIHLYGSLPWSDNKWLLSLPYAFADVLYTFRPELLLFLGSILTWWLGRRLASLDIRFNILVGEFQFGFIILLIMFFAATQMEVSLPGALPVTLAFFIFSLSGIPVAHALEGESWLSGIYRGHWTGLLLLGIVLIILFGVVISLMVTPDLVQVILNILKWLWQLTVQFIDFILSILPVSESSEMLPEDMPSMGSGESDVSSSDKWSLPPWVRLAASLGWGITFGGLILFAFWRISSDVFRFLRRRMATTAGAEYENAPSSLAADIKNLFRRIFSKLIKFIALLKRRRQTHVPPQIAPVRQIYRQFLRWASGSGFARTSSQTPLEFLNVMAEVLPEAQPEMAFITHQYVAIRYGTFVPAETDVHRLRETWQQLKKIKIKKQDNKDIPTGGK